MLPLRPAQQRHLINAVGSASAVIRRIQSGDPQFSRLTPHLAACLDRAQREIDFARQHNIDILTIDDSRYPQRMLLAPDAPIVIYAKGGADLNARHSVAIVGTRHCTAYGIDICNRFLDDLTTLLPDLVVWSGLAYGIDITAHRRCLQNSLPTVAVLAHGLDTLYPSAHRSEAGQMCGPAGALVSEYPHATPMMRPCFISRNRIVAACTHATVVVESGEKGGSLHTARMARDYGRPVHVFPGRATDASSLGCIDLVRQGIARPVCSARQFIDDMGWTASSRSEVQPSLFAQPDDPISMLLIQKMKGRDQSSLDYLRQATALSPSILQGKLTELEMDGLVAVTPNGRYVLRGI